MRGAAGFPAANARRAILKMLHEALSHLERCTELVGENQEVQGLLDAAGDRLRRCMRELRHYLSPFAGVLLDGRDLYGSLERLATYTRRTLGAPLEAFIDPGVSGALPPHQAGQVLQLVREALENALLHAGAGRMALRAEVENGRLVIRLSDDGLGFLVRGLRSGPHEGLAAMQQRAESVRGLLAVHSTPGAGTVVTLTVPVRSGPAE